MFAAFLLTVHAQAPATAPQNDRIIPGAVWPDDRGQHIQAHGGGILKYKGTYYWFGEQRERGLDPAKKYVSCYASTDLLHWQFRGNVLQLDNVEHFSGRWVVERPKVYYNETTKKFVMYMHIDGPVGNDRGYAFARVGVAVSDTVDGQYGYVKSFRPLGHESRDIGQFVDDDGTAYLIFEDRPFGFRIARLTPDYMGLDKEIEPHSAAHGGRRHRSLPGSLLRARLRGSRGVECESEQVRHRQIARRAVVGVQRHRTPGKENVRIAVDDACESGWQQVHDGYFYGRHLALPVALVGLALPVDAGHDWRRDAFPPGAAAVEAQHRDGRSDDR